MEEEIKNTNDNPVKEGLTILARMIARDIYNKRANKKGRNCSGDTEPEKEKS